MEKLGRETSMVTAVSTAPSRDPLPAWDQRILLGAIPLALIVIYAFFPILNNGFVLWDDDKNFLENPYFRGLGADQVTWAWTTFWVGAYQPLAWLLYETQYAFCQLDPRAYHLTSLLFHIANAVVLYFLTVALLGRSRIGGCREHPWIRSVSAGLATALFAVHPLRVETVAWASAQMYLPCILFSMLSVFAYLRAFPSDSSPRWGWLASSFVLFVTALLFHALPVTLPLVLLILDVYPFRRIPGETGRWFGASVRRALIEKVPFLVTSLVFMGLAIAAKPHARFPFEHYDASTAIAWACYAIWFYIGKTLLPLNLIVYCPLPPELNWLGLPFALSIFATFATSALLFSLRGRWPGLLAAWLSYLVILAPNSGIIWINNQIAADRYSYMSMLGLVTLAAAGFRRAYETSTRGRPAIIGMIVISLGVILGLTALTRRQCRTWFNSEILWTHALTHGANASCVAHNSLGQALVREGRCDAAKVHFITATRLNPKYEKPYYNLGNVFYTQGKFEEAKAHYAEALRVSPGYAKAHYNLGVVLETQGNYNEAEAHYIDAARLNPDYFEAHYNLGIVLDRLGKYERALIQLAEVIQLVPEFAEAYDAKAMIMAACPETKFRDGERAVQFATRACELTQWRNPRILSTLAAAAAEAGDFGAAVSMQKRAIELLNGEREKDVYRSRLALYQAKRPYRKLSSLPDIH